MSGFQSPNYTQVPNDFFDMLPDMEYSEIALTLVMIRETFGFHRDGFKMGLNKLAAAAGLSRNATKDGADAAERRGTFRRANPDALSEAEWELVVDTPTSDQGSHSVTTHGQPVTTPPSTNALQVGVKETLKKSSKEREEDDLSLKTKTEALEKLYLESFGEVRPLIRGMLRNVAMTYPQTWYAPAFEAAAKNHGKSLAYVEAILENWKRDGRPKNGKRPVAQSGTAERQRDVEKKIARFVE